MTDVVCCQEAKSGDKVEATPNLTIWRSLEILLRSDFMVGGADMGEGPFPITGSS